MRLSPHFTSSEFRCKDGCHYGLPHETLIEALEDLRAICGGKPLRIVSGIRCPVRNAQVKGASRSQHMAGLAADIPQGYATVAQARRAGFNGIGRKGKWATHVDTRPGPPAEWSY